MRGQNLLTDTALRRMRLPPTGRATVWDGGGLRAEVLTTGARRVARFSFRYTYQGRQAELRLGTWPDRTLVEIRQERDRLRALLRQGVDPRAARRAAEPPSAPSVAELFGEWDRLHLRLACKDGGREVRRYFERDVLPRLGTLAATALVRAHVVGAVDAVLARRAPRAAQLLLVYLRQFCRWAVDRGAIPTDPTGGLRKASIPTNGPRERVLSDEEIRLLGQRLHALPPWAASAVRILLATAVRSGELFAARRSAVDLEQGLWRIPDTKNGRPHLVHLSTFAVACLRQVPSVGPDDRLMPLGGPHSLARLVRVHQLDRPDDPRWTPHDLRRTAATTMQRLGVLPSVIEKCLNHTEPNRLVAVYQRADYLPERRDAFERLGVHLASLL